MTMTKELLAQCMPYATKANIEKYWVPIGLAMEKFQINTPKRQAAFLAQIAHESQNLSKVVENLNYSKDRLLQIFPTYFTPELAEQYERQPEKIANRVYANRMGNGDEASGDGWKYRGRGLPHLTGFDNYEACGIALNYDFVKDPSALEKPGAASLSAGWFWYLKGLNELADEDNFLRISIKINGINRSTGKPNGLNDRIEHWERCKKALGV